MAPIQNRPAHERFDVINHRAPVVLAAAALSGLLLTSACGGASSSASRPAVAATADGATVDTSLLAFTPTTVRIKKGQTVTWVGGDSITHVLIEGGYQVGADGLRTSQTDDKTFSLNLTKKGQRVSHTYATAGTFPYYCSIHHGMNGTVVVS